MQCNMADVQRGYPCFCFTFNIVFVLFWTCLFELFFSVGLTFTNLFTASQPIHGLVSQRAPRVCSEYVTLPILLTQNCSIVHIVMCTCVCCTVHLCAFYNTNSTELNRSTGMCVCVEYVLVSSWVLSRQYTLYYSHCNRMKAVLLQCDSYRPTAFKFSELQVQ